MKALMWRRGVFPWDL